MHWIPISAWVAAAVFAVIVLGYCAYEIVWKARRLQDDIAELLTLRTQLTDIQHGIATAQLRLAAAGLG